MSGIPLSAREHEALGLLARSGDRATVAVEMGLTVNSVSGLLDQSYRKLNVSNAIAAFNAMGWIAIDGVPTYAVMRDLPENPYRFGQWLSEQLRARDITDRMLAKLSGVDHTTISRLRHCERQPGLATAIRLVRGILHATEVGAARAVSVTHEHGSVSVAR